MPRCRAADLRLVESAPVVLYGEPYRAAVAFARDAYAGRVAMAYCIYGKLAHDPEYGVDCRLRQVAARRVEAHVEAYVAYVRSYGADNRLGDVLLLERPAAEIPYAAAKLVPARRQQHLCRVEVGPGASGADCVGLACRVDLHGDARQRLRDGVVELYGEATAFLGLLLGEDVSELLAVQLPTAPL